MSDTPVIFKRSKFKANQRAREEPQQDVQEQRVQSTEDEPSPSVLASKIRNKARQRVQPKTSLSFGAEEEEGNEEVFKIKKSSLSQKLTLRQHPASPRVLPSNLDQASISTHTTRGPVYDEAYLNELKASTPSSRPRIPEGGAHDDDIVTPSTSGDLAVEGLDNIDSGIATIPSQSAVLAAKEKRERMRTTGSINSRADEYISLSLTTRDDEYRGPHPESRLMREDDDLGEGDDDFAEYTSAQTRIALGKKARKAETTKRREEMQDLIADAEEIDEETQEWERAQIKRSGLKPDEASAPTATPVYKPAPIPPPTEIPGLESSVMRISQIMTSMTASHEQNTTSVSTLSAELVQLDERETALRDIVTRTEEKRSWFADFRDGLESVATFLDEKFPRLEQLEDEHVSLLKERRDMIQARRRAENEDDLSIFLGSLSTLPHTAPEELDEMGRVIPRLNAESTRADRRAARAARRAVRLKNRQGEDEEGYSTDATLPSSDAADYLVALQRLSRQSDQILSDVKVKEFKDPSLGIGVRFAAWRERFEDSYVGAWGGLALVGAWEFWTRLEMLGWNPFGDSRTLDSFHWYSSLYEYSRPTKSHGDSGSPELGPDGDLVSATIMTAVLPRLSKLIEGGALDPFSGRDIRRLVNLAEEIEVSVERSNHKFQMFLKSVFSSYQDAVNDFISSQDPFLALDNPPFHPEAIMARRRLLARQEKLMTNIIRWRRYTGSLFGIDEIAKDLLLNCILPVARSGWEVGGEVCVRRISQQLPLELVTSQTKAQLGILES